MILNDQAIKDANIIKKYMNPEGLQSHSYDCMLHPIIKRQSRDFSNTWVDLDMSKVNVSIVIHPGEFALASTIEYFKMPADIIGFVSGKSSIGRAGLQIENAGLIDPLFEGNITLELYNASRWAFTLTPGMFICQVYFQKVEPAMIRPYDKVGKYNGQIGPQTAIIEGQRVNSS